MSVGMAITDGPSSRRAGAAQATISVVIPTLNEAANLPHVLTRLPAWVDEVILVDGHSTDDTVAVARAIFPDVRVVLQDGFGDGEAPAGLEYAPEFAQRRALVGNVGEHRTGGDDIDGSVRNVRQLVSGAV